MDADGFGDLLADGEDGIQRGHRFLKHHGDATAAEAADFFVGHGEDVVAVKADVAGDASVLREQTEDGERGDGFAGA